jgi:hypothetical protein
MALLPRRYAELFGLPTTRLIVAAGFAGRLPFGFYGLVFILAVHQETDSFAIAGAVTAAFALGCGAAPICARAIDRLGARVLLPLTLGHALAIVGIFLLLLGGAPAVPLVLCTWVAGLLMPPLGPIMRSIWRAMLPNPELMTAGISLESVAMEVVFLVGPLLVAVATAVGGLLGLLMLGPLLTVGGTAVVVAEAGHHLGSERPAGEPSAGLLGALRSREVLLLSLNMVPVGICLGCVEVAIAAYANARLGPAYAGVLLASLSVGGITSGLTYGARAQQRNLRVRFMCGCLAVGVLTGLLAVADWIPTTVVLLIGFGAGFAVLLVVANQLVGIVALDGSVTEAYTWSTASHQMGVGTGATIAGIVIEAGGSGRGFATASAAALIAALGAAYMVRRARAAGAHGAPTPAPGEDGASVPIAPGSPSSHQG